MLPHGTAEAVAGALVLFTTFRSGMYLMESEGDRESALT